jgi:hypothetical protein
MPVLFLRASFSPVPDHHPAICIGFLGQVQAGAFSNNRSGAVLLVRASSPRDADQPLSTFSP